MQAKKKRPASKKAKKKTTKKATRRKKVSKEVVKKEVNAMSVDMADWGTQEVSFNDIIIPRVLAMQGMSEMVTDGTARFGELRESLNGEFLGDSEKPVPFVPFKMERVWRVTSTDGKEVKAVIPIDSNPMSDGYNDNMPFESELDGEPVKYYRSLRFYILLLSELADGGALPYMVEFKSTSLRAGKKLATQMFTKNRAAGLSPAGKTFELCIQKQSNDNGTYSVFDVVAKDNANAEQQGEALKWFKTLNGGGAKVHEGGEDAPF